MKSVLKEKNEVIACACDDPAFKAQIAGLKQMTAIINTWHGYDGLLTSGEDTLPDGAVPQHTQQ